MVFYRFCKFYRLLISGGSRIFPGGGANSQKCYYFSIFCRKLHENERIWTPGGGASLAPPLGSANANFNNFEDEYDLKSLADLRGTPGTRVPPRVQILSFSCSFRPKNRLADLLWELAPPSGKSWIRH